VDDEMAICGKQGRGIIFGTVPTFGEPKYTNDKYIW
jgi:hypothetical protein